MINTNIFIDIFTFCFQFSKRFIKIHNNIVQLTILILTDERLLFKFEFRISQLKKYDFLRKICHFLTMNNTCP